MKQDYDFMELVLYLAVALFGAAVFVVGLAQAGGQ